MGRHEQQLGAGGMMKLYRRIWIGILTIVAGAGVLATAQMGELIFGEGDRILILAPHPDDESIGAGGIIQEAVDLDIPLKVCFLTMGDNNEMSFIFVRKRPVIMPASVRKMGMVRHDEALAAATELGVATDQLVFLGYPDFGTLAIWNSHWRGEKPLKSMLTQVTAVPYAAAKTPNASHTGESILRDVTEVIREFKPTHVFVSHPADHNSDHRALYLFAKVALWQLERENIAPEVHPYPVHFTLWPRPMRYHPKQAMTPPAFLADQIQWATYDLPDFQIDAKLAAIKAHRSQYAYSSRFLSAFARATEIFGDFPVFKLPGGIGFSQVMETDETQYELNPELLEDIQAHDQYASDIFKIIEEEKNETEADDNEFSTRSIRGDGKTLTFILQFQRPITRPLHFVTHVFGYRDDMPFDQMPKIRIDYNTKKVVSITDLKQKIIDKGVTVASTAPNTVSITIPLALLGNPEKILTNSKVLRGKLDVDWVAWRTIDLTPIHYTDAPPSPPAAVPQTVAEPLTITPKIAIPTRPIEHRTPAVPSAKPVYRNEYDAPVAW